MSKISDNQVENALFALSCTDSGKRVLDRVINGSHSENINAAILSIYIHQNIHNENSRELIGRIDNLLNDSGYYAEHRSVLFDL